MVFGITIILAILVGQPGGDFGLYRRDFKNPTETDAELARTSYGSGWGLYSCSTRQFASYLGRLF